MDLLVTGSSGFVGRAVFRATETLDRKFQIKPVALDAGVDITDQRSLAAALARVKFDAVLHLAAISYVPDAVKNPEKTYLVNFLGTHNLLRCLKALHFKGRLLFVSSADVYGRVSETALPVDEGATPLPNNPYAVSKLAAEFVCRQWFLSESFDIVIARPFNHFGPGQRRDFVLASIAFQLARIRKGEAPPRIQLGDIEATRDFSDVEDIVLGYAALLKHGQGGEIYNLCSGTERRIADVVSDMVAASGLNVLVVTEASLYRRAEQRRMRGDASKIFRQTGWQTTVPWSESINRLLEFTPLTQSKVPL